MTEPDEALLWARGNACQPWGETDPEFCREVQAGDWDDESLVKWRDQGYRAGAAASEARIKALEEALRPLAALAEKIGTKVKAESCWCGQDGAVIRYGDIQHAESVLKEADQ